MRKSIPVLAMFVLTFFFALPSALGSTVTVLNTYAFIENRTNDIFGHDGASLNLSIDLSDSGGLAALTGFGASIAVTSNNLSFPATFANPQYLPLNSYFPLTVGYEFTSIRSIGVYPLSDFSGTYAYNVTNANTGTASATSHILQNLEVIPTPINLAVNNNSLTPTFTFTDSSPIPGFTDLNRRYNVFIYDASQTAIYKAPNSTSTSFTIPDGILAPGETYYFRAQVMDFDTTESGALQSRSEDYLTVTTPVPEPSTLILLGSGLAGLAGYGRRRFKK